VRYSFDVRPLWWFTPARQYQMDDRRIVPGFPANGSWIVMAWDLRRRNLPAYVVMPIRMERRRPAFR